MKKKLSRFLNNLLLVSFGGKHMKNDGTSLKPINMLETNNENLQKQYYETISFEEIRKQFLSLFLSKIKLLKLQQAIKILTIRYPILNEEGALIILKELQECNKLFLTADGWVIDAATYLFVSKDKKLERKISNNIYKIAYLKPHEINMISNCKACIDCLWVLIDMLPKVSNYMYNESELWNITFLVNATEDRNAKEYFIAKWDKKNVDALSFLFSSHMTELKNMESKYWEKQSTRDAIRIFIILEDEEDLIYVPKHCGISAVLKINEDDSEFDIMKKYSEEEIW